MTGKKLCRKIVCLDNRIRIPESFMNELQIANRQIVDVFLFDDFILIQKPFRPIKYTELQTRFFDLYVAIVLLKSRMLILEAQRKDIKIAGFPKGLLAQIRSKGDIVK